MPVIDNLALSAAEINVKSFGAVGDGATDDTSAIEGAWVAAMVLGGVMVLPSGTYYCPNGLDLSTNVARYIQAMVIRGAGDGSTTIQTHNAEVGIDLGGQNNVRIEDIRLYDDGTTAKVGVARYRSATGVDGNGHFHVYRNLTIEGNYSAACLYSIGSEVNQHFGVNLINGGSGDCYYTDNTNSLSVTLAQTGVEPGSNTVNNFFGGRMVAGGTGSTLHCVDGITDNLNFYGVYLVGTGSNYNILLGGNSADSVQGNKVFNGCRFEGVVDTFTIIADQVWGLKIVDCEFGQNPGLDINWTNTPTGVGLIGGYIDRNWHLNRGLTIPVVTDSYIRIPSTANFHANTLTINHHIANSIVEGDTITIGGSCYIYASVIVENDTYDGVYRIKYGPNTPTSAGNAHGAVVVNQPFGSAPTGALTGTLATADGNNWYPAGFLNSLSYPVFYNGANWIPMGTPWRVVFDSAAPVSGTYAVGDRVYNKAPSAGGYSGWVCVSAGSPGTWKGFGLIEA